MKSGAGQRNCAVCKLNEGIPGNIQLKLCKTPPTRFNEYLGGKICSPGAGSSLAYIPTTFLLTRTRKVEIKYVKLKVVKLPGRREVFIKPYES